MNRKQTSKSLAPESSPGKYKVLNAVGMSPHTQENLVGTLIISVLWFVGPEVRGHRC